MSTACQFKRVLVYGGSWHESPQYLRSTCQFRRTPAYGGSWYESRHYLRSSHRSNASSDYIYFDISFRIKLRRIK